MTKLKDIIILTMIIFIANQTSANAHGDQSVEGHKDIFNKSGLGNYHYHHGYEAHPHPNGVCKYRETEKQNLAKKQGTEDGYEFGYRGLDKEYKYSENDAYYAIYIKSYDEKYEEGKNIAESESEAYYNRGKELGKNGKSIEGNYDNNKIFDKAYKKGYNDGYKEYKAKITEEYRQKGLSDGKIYANKMSFNGLEDYIINAYENGYSEGFSMYKEEIIDNGYSAAFGNGNENLSYTEEEKNWYNEGLNKGNDRLKEIKKEAKQLGLDGKDESELDKFTEGKEQAIEAFKEGQSERLEAESKENVAKYVIIGVIVVTVISIGFVLKKIKKEKEYDVDDKVA